MTDQNSQFFAILTAVGEAKQANANALGVPWSFSQMAVGDANGTDPTPLRTQTSLINERRRAPLNQISIDPNNANIIVAEQVIPPDVGGWWIREIGLYDTDGDLVAVANCAPSFKPLLSQGTGKTQVVRLNIIVTSTANVQLKIDPAVVLATRDYVDQAITAAINKQDAKRSVLVATTADIVLAGAQTIDGLTVPAGARVLVKDQVAGKDNGIYLTAAGAWTRAEDADASIEVTPGLFVHVEQGALNADTVWQLMTDAPIVLGTTALTFDMIAGKTGINAGTYRSVTVDNKGRVTGGSNPTTLDGYGITDAFSKMEIVEALKLKADKATTLAGYGITDAYTKAQLDELIAGQSRVVSTPAISGAASSKAGVPVALTASASSLLVGGSIASFTFTLPDGTSSTVAATSGSATKSVLALGSTGTNYVVTVFATDSAGNKSAVATKSIAIVDHNAPTVPTTLTVAATAYQNSTGNTLSASGATASDSATITYSITQSGPVALTFSKTSGIAANEVVTFTAPAVAADTPVTISVIAVDSMGGVSPAKSTVITVAVVPSQAGIAFGGGYYVGRMKVGDQSYALIVSPKAQGEAANMTWRTTNVVTPGAASRWDGASNTQAMLAAGSALHPAASFCAGLSIGGYVDWCLPAQDQLEMCYRTFKPIAPDGGVYSNDTTSGTNPNSDPQTGLYTSNAPGQTAIAAFRSGGPEAFGNLGSHLSSTTTGSGYMRQHFSSGGQNNTSPVTQSGYVRAVRMIKI